MQKFDPYHRWLGIPPHEQPPTLYRLLGISDFESDREVITEASYRQIGHVKQYASGPNREAANEILNELSKAQVILLNPRKKTQYDISIQEVEEEEEDGDVLAPMIVQTETSAGSRSFKGRSASAAIKRKRRKQSILPLFAALGIFSFVLVTFGYWWIQASKVPPVNPQPEKSNTKTTTGPAETEIASTDKTAEPTNLAGIPKPAEKLKIGSQRRPKRSM